MGWTVRTVEPHDFRWQEDRLSDAISSGPHVSSQALEWTVLNIEKQLTSGVCSSSLSGNFVGFRPMCVVVLAGVAGVDINDGLLPGVEVKSPRPAIVLFRDISAALQ
ncbi:hypothetical protein E2562_036983 [Oryza meyeriana var. granulata]|uniref:Uncharacterized protein n=1 Tax=Oryza meyeriana var. granulata TaxID=110450 RepID=A0A6G1F225_9ORYZ|nr:hypothetical protein E2562_036983 [Oryza meyeriana var. granulata]